MNTTLQPCAAALESPALRHRSAHYPACFGSAVPWKVRMLETVRTDLAPVLLHAMGKPLDTIAIRGGIYECWVNSHGAVAALCSNGERLGLKPDEFEVVEWHEGGGS